MRFDTIYFRDFVDTLEKRVPVRIFYADEWVDSLRLNINVRNVSLEQLLKETVERNGFSYIITAKGDIILSRGYVVKTGFDTEYREYLRKARVILDSTNNTQPPATGNVNRIDDEYRLFRIGRQISGSVTGTATLSGRVTNVADGQGIGGAIIYVEKLKAGVMTSDNGYYSIDLPKGQYQVDYKMLGMNPARRNVLIFGDGRLDVTMDESTSEVEAVVIKGSRTNVKEVRTGIEKINIKMLKQIPMGLGEADVLKSSLLLPGVQSVSEASAGFNVRGGSTDQNLVFLNNAPIINASHFFGFFSAFNSDLISDVTLYKSMIPAKFGGRLSSVMEITSAEGNKEKVKVSGGISPVTGRLMVEGPIKKINGTFIVGSRATYSDWILGMLKNFRLSQSRAGFYDFQGTVKSQLDKKNSISLSGYLSDDKFSYYTERAFNYGNLALTLNWSHAYSQKFFSQFYAIISNYSYQLDMKEDSTLFSTMDYAMRQKVLRSDFTYYLNGRHKIEFGLDATHYSLSPGTIAPVGDYSTVEDKTLEKEFALEPSLYASDEYEVNPSLTVSAGIRGTLFTSFGPGTQYIYQEGVSRSVNSLIDTSYFKAGQITKVYPGFDYRLSARFIIVPDLSLKIGIQQVNQYIHMISNTTSVSPTDIWKLSDRYIRPQRSNQFSIGLYNTFGKKPIEISAEAYYKKLFNILDYKGGAVLLMNEHLETDVISGIGKAYGVEFMIKKQTGDVTGWLGYTYSRVLLKVNGEYEVERINGGEYFPADYDKPHDLKLVVNAKMSRRFNVTTNFMYSTGRPITYPVAFYTLNNSTQVYYSNRNEYRVPDYIRLDLAATINGNLKAKKLNHSSFTFTLYNVLGRKNPYSIFFRNEGGEIRGYQMTIFGKPIFMATYNFRILGNATGDF